jgi:hypothetical protein
MLIVVDGPFSSNAQQQLPPAARNRRYQNRMWLFHSLTETFHPLSLPDWSTDAEVSAAVAASSSYGAEAISPIQTKCGLMIQSSKSESWAAFYTRRTFIGLIGTSEIAKGGKSYIVVQELCDGTFRACRQRQPVPYLWLNGPDALSQQIVRAEPANG